MELVYVQPDGTQWSRRVRSLRAAGRAIADIRRAHGPGAHLNFYLVDRGRIVARDSMLQLIIALDEARRNAGGHR